MTVMSDIKVKARGSARPAYRGAIRTSYVRDVTVPSLRGVPRSNIPQARNLTPNGIIPGLPTGLGIMPSRTAPTSSAFGGVGGGTGISGVSAGDLGLGGIGTSISSLGSGIMGTVTGLIPIAIKVVVAVIVIKIVLWLLKGRRR